MQCSLEDVVLCGLAAHEHPSSRSNGPATTVLAQQTAANAQQISALVQALQQAQATATSSASNEAMKELVKAAVQVATRTSAAVHSTADSVSSLGQSHQEAQQTFKESHLRAEQTAAEALKQRVREHGEVERLEMIRTPQVFGPSNSKEEHEGWSEFKHNMKSWIGALDKKITEGMVKIDNAKDTFISMSSLNAEEQESGRKLYTILASYTKGRPLRILKQLQRQNGS